MKGVYLKQCMQRFKEFYGVSDAEDQKQEQTQRT